MIVIDKNPGTKVDYTVEDTHITFGDDLGLNLAVREQDWPVHIDICRDANNELVIGTAQGRAYVAEIDIPARKYKEIPVEPAPAEGEPTGPNLVPVPLNMDDVTLTLWAIE